MDGGREELEEEWNWQGCGIRLLSITLGLQIQKFVAALPLIAFLIVLGTGSEKRAQDLFWG